ncbi:MAG: hypothetical protein JKY48_18560 [Flavobacteriales bacterium]|nr:hypothetical protein [Flavobacteriales bacterium]
MKGVFRFTIVLFFGLILLEFGLRVTGHTPFQLPVGGIESNPKGCFIPQMNKGIVLAPGKFTVNIGELTYETRHTLDSMRSTSLNLIQDSITKPIVQLYGCSFTYGMGVNDEETYPWLLQERFRLLKVENRGVPGYGQVQLLNELRDNKMSFEGVKVIVLNYLPFHDERNTLNAAFRHKLNIGYQLSKKQDPELLTDFSYPYAAIDGGALQLDQLEMKDIERSFFWESNSALLHILFNGLRDLRVDAKHDFRVTTQLIKEIKAACDSRKIELILTLMLDDQRSYDLIDYCQSIGVNTQDVSIDLNDKQMTNYPYDQHPSPKAHQIIADKLSPYFQQLL